MRSLVIGKIANQRAVLMRALRDHGDELAPERRAAVEAASERLGRRFCAASTFADASARRCCAAPKARRRTSISPSSTI